MYNPSQVSYSLEELYTLKPESDINVTVKPATPVVSIPDQHVAIIPDMQMEHSGFWHKNKWYFIVGGAIVLGGIAYYFYVKNKKKEKDKDKSN